MATNISHRSRPKSVINKMTRNMIGKLARISKNRIITLSIFPPTNPAVAPYSVPIKTATSAPSAPTISEIRPPRRVRTNKSRPRLSVPNQCLLAASGALCIAPKSGSSKA